MRALSTTKSVTEPARSRFLNTSFVNITLFLNVLSSLILFLVNQYIFYTFVLNKNESCRIITNE